MAISKKGRRRIVVGGREYLWWVRTDWTSHPTPGRPTLTVASEDRRFMVRYVLHQSHERRHLIVVGREFRGTDRPGPHRYYPCPAFGPATEFRPAHVAELIGWCTEAGPLPKEFEAVTTAAVA
ncbi:hypothetical protein ACFVMC_19395 [Nocardia sp. NPDC127579]|uniref:hypothetical protein n=1 Tax=Nocardia sp. NPDC127579 TaxID=3345402 RepID=UPI003625D3EC